MCWVASMILSDSPYISVHGYYELYGGIDYDCSTGKGTACIPDQHIAVHKHYLYKIKSIIK